MERRKQFGIHLVREKKNKKQTANAFFPEHGHSGKSMETDFYLIALSGLLSTTLVARSNGRDSTALKIPLFHRTETEGGQVLCRNDLSLKLKGQAFKSEVLLLSEPARGFRAMLIHGIKHRVRF